jgi:hypothetical protein
MWTEKKERANSALEKNDLEMATSLYVEAAEMAISEKAKAVEIAKCWTNASHMAYHQFMKLAFSWLPEQSPPSLSVVVDLINSSTNFACKAILFCNSWLKGYLYRARAIAYTSIIQKVEKNELAAVSDIDHYIQKVHSNLTLEEIKDTSVWQTLRLLNHPLYLDFIRTSPAFDIIKNSKNVIYVDPRGKACFESLKEAIMYLNHVHYLSGEIPASVLIAPGFYDDPTYSDDNREVPRSGRPC